MQKSRRSKRGVSLITLALVIGTFVALPLGLLVFEIHRAELARQQLRAICESAALGAAATLAGSDIQDALEAQTNAMSAALSLFRSHSIIGCPLNNAYLAQSLNTLPPIRSGNLYVQFLDPHNNMQVVTIGDPRGKVVKVTGTFTLVPSFGTYLHIGAVPICSAASGGVPTLDVVLCFDLSGSIDDQTPVTFVRRQWDPTNSKIAYNITRARAGSPAGTNANGKLYDILGPPSTGSRTNAVFPQWLSSSNQSDHRYALSFSEDGAANGLRGSPNAGSPPGNCPPGNASVGDLYTYTDLVTNIDGNEVFGGISSNGFDFPDIATVTEAARGNLENSTVFNASKANLTLTNITPKVGYKAEYIRLAALQLHPISEAQQAADAFLNIINTNTDAHFGFVAFANDTGTSPTSTVTQSNIDATYSSGGQGQFPMPQVKLNQTPATTNYDTIKALLPKTGANTATNIGDALNEAVLQFNSSSTRKGSKKAIILFTDGQPTVGGPLNSDPWANARAAAVVAKGQGIPVYTIGLAQNPEIVPSETAILNDTNSSPSAGGIAAIAGNGGKFYIVTNTNNLRFTFENVARHLSQLVR